MWRKGSGSRAGAHRSPSGDRLLETMEMLHFTCSLCGKKLKMNARGAGKAVRCPGCGVRTVVPMPGLDYSFALSCGISR